VTLPTTSDAHLTAFSNSCKVVSTASSRHRRHERAVGIEDRDEAVISHQDRQSQDHRQVGGQYDMAVNDDYRNDNTGGFWVRVQVLGR